MPLLSPSIFSSPSPEPTPLATCETSVAADPPRPILKNSPPPLFAVPPCKKFLPPKLSHQFAFSFPYGCVFISPLCHSSFFPPKRLFSAVDSAVWEFERYRRKSASPFGMFSTPRSLAQQTRCAHKMDHHHNSSFLPSFPPPADGLGLAPTVDQTPSPPSIHLVQGGM